MKGRLSVAPRVSIGVLALLAALGTASAAWAQLTDADIAALRERGVKEGWTFTVGRSAATEVPLSQLCGLKLPADWAKGVKFDPCVATRGLPSRYDWREHTFDPSNPNVPLYPLIRNQGSCGSCWAFAAVGALEWALAREAHLSANFSEQWLVSCDADDNGCEGGSHFRALDYLTAGGRTDICGKNGPVFENVFPYTSRNYDPRNPVVAPCSCTYDHPGFRLHSWFGIGSPYGAPTPQQLKQAIYDHGPIAVTVYVNDAWYAYESGVFNACESATTNHAVLLVGWDDNQGTDGVWFLKNSWGPEIGAPGAWGEQGYMRIEYDCCRVGYAAAYVNYRAPDCNQNGTPDSQDIASGTSHDCNQNSVPDECEPGGTSDCNHNGVPDVCDLFNGTSRDCNSNGIPDECDLASGASRDCNGNGVPDECEFNVAYRVDDGSMDNVVGTELGNLIWLNSFTVQASGGTIDAIDIAWGDVPSGTPTTLAIWRDPTNDKDPHDAQLVWKSSAPVWVSNPYTDLFTTAQVPDVYVGEPGDVFFVGAYMQTSDFAAPVDRSVNPGKSWAAEGTNLDNLAANDDTLFCMDDWYPGVWLIRAHAAARDCNTNGVLDACDLASGLSHDCNLNSIPDECEATTLPIIARQPSAVTACDGTAATFTIQVKATISLAYQWRKNGTPIEEATEPSFTIATVSAADVGAYDVIVTNPCGSVTSEAATLAAQRLILTAHPQDLTVRVGDIFTLSAAADGPSPLTYQWRKDGTPLIGAEASVYSVPQATLADAGAYDLVFTCPCGSQTSNAATVIVSPAVPAGPSPTNEAVRVVIDPALAWGRAPAATSYDVHFGTTSDPPWVGSTTDPKWTPGVLAYSTKYYWKIVARNTQAATAGPVWSFRTQDQPPAAPAGPNPPDGTADVPVNVALSWATADRTVFYKVLIGTDPTLKEARLLASTASSASTPDNLAAGTVYYWRVIAKNDAGISNGPVWSFTTAAANQPVGATDSQGTASQTPAETDNAAQDTSGLDQPEVTQPQAGTALCPTASAGLVTLTLLGLWGARSGATGNARRRT